MALTVKDIVYTVYGILITTITATQVLFQEYRKVLLKTWEFVIHT